MKKTLKDIEKMGNSTVGWIKTGIYYLYLPVVIFAGIKTVSWEQLAGGPPM
jgi:hypothetical protein